MSYVRVIARRDDGLEVEFEVDGAFLPTDRDGTRTAEDIQRAADKAKAAIVSGGGRVTHSGTSRCAVRTLRLPSGTETPRSPRPQPGARPGVAGERPDRAPANLGATPW